MSDKLDKAVHDLMVESLRFVWDNPNKNVLFKGIDHKYLELFSHKDLIAKYWLNYRHYGALLATLANLRLTGEDWLEFRFNEKY